MDKNMLGYHWLCTDCAIKSTIKGKCSCGKELVHYNYPEHDFFGFRNIKPFKEVKK